MLAYWFVPCLGSQSICTNMSGVMFFGVGHVYLYAINHYPCAKYIGRCVACCGWLQAAKKITALKTLRH
jgi:hypothetical protein